MLRRFALVSAWLIAAAGAGVPSATAAKSEEWRDTQGNRFRAEPAEVLGPLALFRVSKTAGRLVPWHLLAPEDCVRFYEQTRTKPPRASDWVRTQGAISQELPGHVLRVENDRLVPADLKGRLEPEFFILFFADHGEGKSWEMIGSAGPPYAKLQQDYPGMVEALFYGLRHTKLEHTDMAVSMKMPWLVTDYYDQSRLETISRFAPGEGFGMLIVSRDGVPLFSSSGDSEAAVRKAMDELAGLLDLMRPDNPSSWNDRAYYLRAVQPAAYRTGRCDPVLLGNPFRAEALKQRGVFRFDATIQVAADGHVTGVSVKPDENLSPAMAEVLGDALRQAVLVPAVENGKFVDGICAYHFEVPR